jgi:hypothetical protein
MLKVSEDQLAALEAHFGEEFAVRMTDVLFRSFPRDCEETGREGILVFVRASLKRARAFRVERESDLGKYVVTEFVAGTAAMREMVREQREKLRAAGGRRVDPTILVQRTYEAMFRQLKGVVRPDPEVSR